MTGTANNETPGTSGDRGARPPQADVIQPDDGAQRAAVPPAAGHRRPWSNSRQRFPQVRPDPADLGALAKDAVISFLHDASIATAEREAVRGETARAGTRVAATAGTGVANGPGEADGISAANEPLPGQGPGQGPGRAAADASRAGAESVAWQAASVSLATLDRIEAAAASIEADIRAALQAQADLQAGAGAAAEAAVSAATSAWQAAGTAVEADSRAKIAVRRVEHFVTITVILLIIAMILVIVGATPLG
jgi:hypothetical protein